MLVLGATASAWCSEEEEILASSTDESVVAQKYCATSLESLVRTWQIHTSAAAAAAADVNIPCKAGDFVASGEINFEGLDAQSLIIWRASHHIQGAWKTGKHLSNTVRIGPLKWSSSLQIQDKVFWGSAHSSQLFPAAFLCSFFNEFFLGIFYGNPPAESEYKSLHQSNL